MNLSKKKFTFERKKIKNKENVIIKQCDENTDEIKIKNKYFSQKNLFCEELVLEKEKNIKSYEKESEASESPKFSQIQVDQDNSEVNNISQNPKLQYLINQNVDQNIDFINTLLKLKGIPLNQLKNYKSSKNLSNKPKFKEENNVVQKSKKKVIIRNDKNNQSNSSNQTTKINSTNNNQQNGNEDDDISKNSGNITSSVKEINNDMNEIIKNRIKIKNYENIKAKTENNSNKRELLTLSNRTNNVNIEKKAQKKDFENKLKKEWSFNEKNGIIYKKFNNKNNLTSSKENIKSQEKINFNISINDKIIKKNNYIKIPKGIERLYLKKMNLSNFTEKRLDNTKTNKGKEEFKKTSQNINFIMKNNDHHNHTINNVNNNNIAIKKPKINRKIVKRQKSMKNKIKKESEITKNNISKYMKEKEFLENKSIRNFNLTSYQMKNNKSYKNISKEIKTESKSEKNNLFNLKKNYKTLQKENNINSENRINTNEEYNKECDLKIPNIPSIEKNKIQNKKSDGTNSIKSIFSKFPITSKRKIKIYFPNNPNYKNHLNITPNKGINLYKRNNQKYKYIDDLNSYTNIAINKMLSSPPNKKEVICNINNINNINHEEYYKRKEDINIKNYNTNNSGQNNLCSLLDKTATSHNSKIFKKLNEISPSEDENINITTEIANDEFNDEGINENDKNDNIRYKKIKKAEIFLFDNTQD